MTPLNRLCVFCGSSRGHRPAYSALAGEVGRALARRGIGIVYGGGSIGLMGRLADAALAEGGEVLGVIPQALLAWEVAHDSLTRLEVVPSMHARKARMAELADGFLALPGGYGTFEELFEVLTWAQLGLHQKPCAVLDVEGYFSPLLRLADHAVEEGFLSSEHRGLLLSAGEINGAIDAIGAFEPQPVRKFLVSTDET